MANRSLGTFLSHVFRAVSPAGLSEPDDGQLLHRFAGESDKAAFAVLLQRHGPMVWGVCRRVLSDADADDAFQATFLVLVRKAGSIVKRESIASWLHGVAHRVALRARSNARDRRQHESERATMTPQAESPAPGDLRDLLDEELRRLPEKYRAPLVLCYLEGKTNDEAAALLGWTRGTVAGRMARARDLLRERLTRRGLALASGAFAAVLAENSASAAVPVALVSLTLQTVKPCAAGLSQATPAVSLAEGVVQSMKLTRLKLTALLLTVTLVGVGIGIQLLSAPADPAPNSDPPIRRVTTESASAKADRAAVVQGNTALALDLYAQLRGEIGNLFFSPHSISTALAMTFAGARGETANEMARALHFTLEQARLHPAMGELVREFNGNGKPRGYQFSIANALWVQKDYPFRADFVNLNRDSYGAGLNEVDFAGNIEQSRQTINAWVEKQTQEKIKELFKEGILKRDTRLALTNAIYFKGDWLYRFPKDRTVPDEFHLSARQTVRVPLMNQEGEFKVMASDGFQALELPYKGKELSMIVFLPDKVDGLADFEKAMTPAKVEKWLAALRPRTGVAVALPKFKAASEFLLQETLKRLGMRDAFEFGKADFSGMDGSRELSIGPVVHKAYVDVNEEGTEAAAATGVGVFAGGGPPVLRADHPFVYLIRDNRSGSILFLGRVVDPRP